MQTTGKTNPASWPCWRNNPAAWTDRLRYDEAGLLAGFVLPVNSEVGYLVRAWLTARSQFKLSCQLPRSQESPQVIASL